jgi:hypothetical protein
MLSAVFLMRVAGAKGGSSSYGHDDDAIPQTFAQAVYYLDTPSSSIAIRLNSLRYLQSYISSPVPHSSSSSSPSPSSSSLSLNPNSMADRIKINQLILDNILFILNCEDVIPDLRKRQLIKTECFLLLSQVLKSKSLFSGVPNVTLDDHMTPPPHPQQPIPSVLRSQDDEMVKRSSHSRGPGLSKELDPVLSPSSPQSRKGNRTKQKIRKESEEKSSPLPPPAVSEGSSSPSHPSPTLSTSSSSPHLNSPIPSASASLTTPATVTATATAPHQELFASQLKKASTTNLSLIKKKPFYRPRQSVLIGSRIHEENLVPGVDPKNHLEMDKQLGYQKSRLWLPFNGPGLPPLPLPPSLLLSSLSSFSCSCRNELKSNSSKASTW